MTVLLILGAVTALIVLAALRGLRNRRLKAERYGQYSREAERQSRPDLYITDDDPVL